MGKLLVVLVLGLVLLLGLYYSFDFDFKAERNKGELEFNIQYTPSQNLAIMEGRFDDARESIELINGR